MELCEPPVPDLEALIEEPESRVLPFCGSEAVKHVDRVADRQTGYPPRTPTTQNRGRSGHERERREEEGGSVDDERWRRTFFSGYFCIYNTAVGTLSVKTGGKKIKASLLY